MSAEQSEDLRRFALLVPMESPSRELFSAQKEYEINPANR